MTFEILDAEMSDHRHKWISAWQTSSQEPFSHPAYVQLFCKPGDRALCATFNSASGGRILYAFVLRTIEMTADGALFDIISPYGYGGAYLGHKASPADGQKFWLAFDEWAISVGVVSEFIRMDVDLSNLVPYPGNVYSRAQNVVCDLGLTPDELWAGFEKKVRKNVRKAERSGIEVIADLEGKFLDDFLRIYEGTMERRDAGAEYYFSRDFFQSLIRDLPENIAFFHALHEGRIVSTELVLRSANRMYSYLGGTDQAYFDYRPNDALKVKMMEWGISENLEAYVLGGGAQAGDGIERYKRSFAPEGLIPFHTGQRVIMPEQYARLADNRSELFQRVGREWPEPIVYFPAYRLPFPDPVGSKA